MFGNHIFDARLISDLLDRIKRVAKDGIVSLHESSVPEDFGRLPHCFRLEVSIDGWDFSAWGAARSRDEAAAKCLAELIERICLRHSYPITYKRAQGLFERRLSLKKIQLLYPIARNWVGGTSSGVALHSKRSAALAAGMSELIERHTILKALAHHISPAEVDAPTITREFSIPREIVLRFFVWKGALGVFVCTCQIRVRNGGAYYSFGAAQSVEEAAEKAFLEGSGMISFVPAEPLSVDATIVAGDLDSFQRYHRYSPDLSTLEFFNKTVSQIQEIDSHFKRQDFFYSECAVPAFLGDIRPLVCVRVVSPLLQPLFFDIWKPEYLNPAAGFGDGCELPSSPHIIS